MKLQIISLFHLHTQSRSEEIDDALNNNVISKYYIPDYIIMDLDRAFMSGLVNYLFKKFYIQN